ncbi:hypothetical protein E2986_09648 [Frieseomelitta varia]|uniref:Uncharacterized protein n=1 Tax=Frieseomelitta varia TaxID=561572 RepID=A0A833RQJ3_9HYME|nr:hypothetical protein E2986_09648 [Frieseomelitta varia]
MQILQNDQLMKGNGSQDQTDGERIERLTMKRLKILVNERKSLKSSTNADRDFHSNRTENTIDRFTMISL